MKELKINKRCVTRERMMIRELIANLIAHIIYNEKGKNWNKRKNSTFITLKLAEALNGDRIYMVMSFLV